MKTKREVLNQNIALLQKADRAYYNKGKPIMTDSEYDVLKAKIKKARPNSPVIERIGFTPEKAEKKIHRKSPMGSLNNALTVDALVDWVEEMEGKGLITDEYVWASPKVDGLSLQLIYDEHELIGGYTRGDGVVGVDISPVVAKMDCIPKFIVQSGYWDIRGECYLSHADFLAINEALRALGREEYTLSRSAAVGLVKSGVAKPPYAKGASLRFLAWQLHSGKPSIMEKLDTEKKRLNYMRDKMDMPTVSLTPVKTSLIREFPERWAELRKTAEYPMDGIVVSVNTLTDIDRAGYVLHTPKAKIAYKFPPAQKKTVVTEIKPQVGRTGRITPVVKFKPIILDGSEVSEASGHNYTWLAAKGVRVGATIIVEKSGDIIPAIVQTLVIDKSFKKEKPPEQCPICKEPTQVILRGLYCQNEMCPSRTVQRMIHFCKNMGMLGFGPDTLNRLAPLMPSMSSLFLLKKSTLQQALDSDKKGSTLFAEINKVKNNVTPFATLLESLGIDRLGSELSKKVAEAFRDPRELCMVTSEKHIRMIMMAGGITGEDTLNFIPERLWMFMPELIKLCEILPIGVVPKKKGLLLGKSFCVTGTLSMPRNKIASIIETHGGTMHSTMKKITNFLIAGEGGGDKRKKASEWGVPVITEEELRNMIQGKG